MSHIHIPDGILPIWILILGWLFTGLFLYISIRKIRRHEAAQKLPYIGIVSALMIIAMMIEIVPIAYHFNFSVLAGIILGPSLAFISVFIVDIIIAMFGHGGITVVGLNSLVLGLEAAAGYYCFRFCLNFIKNHHQHFYSAFSATILSLILSTFLMIGYVSLVKISVNYNLNQTAVNIDTSDTEESLAHEINIHRFTKTIIFMSSIGWLLESLMTGFIIKYLYKINPGVIWRSVN